jgi:hypothetical protein
MLDVNESFESRAQCARNSSLATGSYPLNFRLTAELTTVYFTNSLGNALPSKSP